MEPAQMNPKDPFPSDQMLREAMDARGVPDNGFTERVISALPRRRTRPLPQPVARTLAWTLSGTGLAMALCIVGSSEWGSGALVRLGDAAASLATRPWIVFALAVSALSYLTALIAAKAALLPPGGRR
jgi:hypothetical protein